MKIKSILSIILVLGLNLKLMALTPTESHAELLTQILKIQDKTYIALTIKHEKGWHTYWKNPGDAGLPTKFFYRVQNSTEKLELNVLEWPVPHRYFEAGDMLAFGYGEDPTFFSELPKESYQALSVSPVSIDIELEWLICKDLCIPGKGLASLSVSRPQDDVAVKSKESHFSSTELQDRFESLPQKISWPSNLNLYLSRKKDNEMLLHVEASGDDFTKINDRMNFLTPFPSPIVGYKREKLIFDQKNKSLFSEFPLEWDGEFNTPPRPLPLNGLLNPPVVFKFLMQKPNSKKYYVIEKDVSSFSLTSSGIDDLLKNLGSETETKMVSTKSDLSFYLFAFLGGLILNLMPCVLPVITLKLFGLIKYQNYSHKKIIKHNLSYSFGVLSTFLTLALSIVLIKNSGEQVGWGFQLQSPLFVFFMINLLFIMSLNLFGLFEFRVPGGNFIGKTQLKDGFIGDFMSGVLSTILSTPCSAPFLGTALTFAFTTDSLHIFSIFFMIGLGLSFPFLLTSIFPKWLHLLPKPGAWMEKLKYFLGLSLLLTVIWLSDVFMNLVDSKTWFWPMMCIFATTFFSFFLNKKYHLQTWVKATFLIPLIFSVYSLNSLSFEPAKREVSKDTNSKWQEWSFEEMEKLKGQWAFIDFTAEWCLTCKVNKKLVLDTESFLEFMSNNKIHLLEGDWTKRDDRITEFLNKYGAVGVPAYFLQKPNGEIIFLGETISVTKIQKHLSK